MWRLHPYNLLGLRHVYMAWANRCWRCLWSPYHGPAALREQCLCAKGSECIQGPEYGISPDCPFHGRNVEPREDQH